MNKHKVSDYISLYSLYIILFVLLLFFSLSNRFFLTPTNIINVIRQVTPYGICAVGMTAVILTGGIDLSTGSVLGLAAALAARLMLAGVHPALATLISLITGIACGLLNGFFINKMGMPPLITTLGTMIALRGVASQLTGGVGISGFTDSYRVMGQGYVGIVPIPVIIMTVAFALGYILLEMTKFGRYVYGIGGNEEVVRLSGINVHKIKYQVYAINGFLSALAGLVLLSRVMSVQALTGQGYEMNIITAVMLGGVSIKGGEGKISRVIIGVLIMGILQNGMAMMGINPFYQLIIQGIVLLLAVSYDKLMLVSRNKLASI